MIIEKPWSEEKQKVLSILQVNPTTGLSLQEADQRKLKYGENIYGKEKKVTFFGVFSHEIREPMILLLLLVGVLYSIFGELYEAITIFVIITVLILIEIYNEFRAKKTIESLFKLAIPKSPVLRDGKVMEVDTKDIVPGDILLLKPGQRIPADGRLLEAYGLQIEQSALTGESVPVPKNSEQIIKANPDLLERDNMIYAETTVTRGKGKAVIVYTGLSTEIGKIAELTTTYKVKGRKSSLKAAMKQLTYYLVFVALFFCILIPVIGIIQGRNLIIMILTGLSLAFATIPEELPIIIMVVLALGAYKLSSQNALIKDLKTAETLGTVTVIATDKTGTLTENKMTLMKIYVDKNIIEIPNGNLTKNQKNFLELGAICNDVIKDAEGIYIGDPMELASVQAAKDAGISQENLQSEYTLKEEYTFDNSRKMMSQIYEKDDKYISIIKGAAENILDNSIRILINNNATNINQDIRNEIQHQIEALANEGLRVIAFAVKELQEEKFTQEIAEQELTFLGLAGFLDPPRMEVKKAISDCINAGIKIKMITGDYEITAKKIAETVGIRADKIIIGSQLEGMPETKLQEIVMETSVFARTSPEHKLKIVTALQAKGERVAVTGDGINDAPALRNANIGISMGVTGTDVAKNVSDMVLLDDNFATITLAVETARKLYENLRKGVRYYLAVKLALIGIFLLPVLFDIPLPFAPIQIILLELFMDLAASSAFVVEPSESNVMAKPPRDLNKKFMDTKLIIFIILGGLSLMSAVLLVYLIAYSFALPQALTMAFATWMISHIFLAYNMRTEKDPLFKVGFMSNSIMHLWAILVVIVLIVIIYIPPLRVIFGTYPLTIFDWLFILGISAITTFWIELIKIINFEK